MKAIVVRARSSTGPLLAGLIVGGAIASERIDDAVKGKTKKIFETKVVKVVVK